MNTQEKMVKKRILFLPFLLLIGLVVIALLVIDSTNSEKKVENNPIFIAQPKDLLTPKDILFDNLNTISGDQRHLAFVTAEDFGMKADKIWLTNSDGSSPTIVAKADDLKYVSNPIFSPDSKTLAYLRIYPFQIWVYNVETGLGKKVEPDDKRLEKFLNPSLGYGGETYFKWVGNNNIEFENNLTSPAERYSIDINTRDIRKTGSSVVVDAGITDVPLMSQRDETWGNDQLGACTDETIHTAGCAVSAMSMLLKSYGFDTDPQKLNNFLRENNNQGYVDDCNIKWYIIPNYFKGIRLVGAFFNEKTFTRLDKELARGNPVIIGFNKVPFTSLQHWVVVTKKVGDTYYINDPWSLDGKQETLDDFGGTFDHLIVFEKTS
ncbi:MAG: C39 family peptidase [Candidatus Dojkabacteria bacterium]